MRRIPLASAFILAAVTSLWAQAGQVPAWSIWANPSAAASNLRSATLNAMFNGAFCSTANTFVARVGGSWVCQGIGAGLSFSGGNLVITVPLSFALGGCNATTQTACTNNIFPTPTRAGDIAFWNGSIWTNLAGNNSGTQVLSENASGVPSWTSASSGTVTSAVIAAGNGIAVTGTCTITTTGTCTVAVNLSELTNSLGADVALNNTANFFDGPSVAQGTSGTWFASGSVTVQDTASAANVLCKLWDGTTVIASSFVSTVGAAKGLAVALSGYLASPAGNIRISCKDNTAITGQINFNSTGTSKDSTLSVFRIN